jgi:hypothetical protein
MDALVGLFVNPVAQNREFRRWVAGHSCQSNPSAGGLAITVEIAVSIPAQFLPGQFDIRSITATCYDELSSFVHHLFIRIANPELPLPYEVAVAYLILS